jgi:hypothetical protein
MDAQFLLVSLKGRKFEIPRRRWEVNIKIGVDWIYLG